MNNPAHSAHPTSVSSADDFHVPGDPEPPEPTRQRRRRRSPAQWRELVDRQPDSGLDVEAFCQQHDLGIAGFYAWRRRLRAAKPAATATESSEPMPAFLRVHAEPEPSGAAGAAVTASFPGGVTLRLGPEHIGMLIAALRETAPC